MDDAGRFLGWNATAGRVATYLKGNMSNFRSISARTGKPEKNNMNENKSASWEQYARFAVSG